jgi:membrane-associated phospholipid phosphatase
MNLNIKDESQINSKKEISDNNKIVITETSIKESFKTKDYQNIISNKIKIIFIIIYFAIIIWVETLIRENLFLKSIPLQERLQKDGKFINILDISKIISIFGVEILPSLIYALVFLFMPLNYSFLILQVLIYSSYLANIMKMIYQSDRPNWKSDILIYSCNYGYGNPSGHSLTSISLYLCLSHILINYFNISKMLKILIFMFFIIFSFLIMMSRYILAAHSFNQILYGFFLGLGLYYIMIYIIGYHKYQSINF